MCVSEFGDMFILPLIYCIPQHLKTIATTHIWDKYETSINMGWKMLTTAFCTHLWKNLFLPIQLVEKYKQMVPENVQMHYLLWLNDYGLLQVIWRKKQKSKDICRPWQLRVTSPSRKMTKLEVFQKAASSHLNCTKGHLFWWWL